MARTGRERRIQARHRLRHGRHLDRRRPFRRRIRARLRDRSRRRAHARADDEDPYCRGWRRLDPLISMARAFASAPTSAGADPGPACYRRGGPLTVTDANLMTGKLIPDLFPKVFGPRGDEPLDAEIVRERFTALARDIGDGREPEAVADGFLAIAVAKMAEAIKTISVARGYDVTRYALNCFGGAGGQHACDVADALAITTVLIHPFSSLLSAYGMGLADIRAQRAQGGRGAASACEALLRVKRRRATQLADVAVAEVEGQGVARERIKVHRARAYPLRRLRYADRRCRSSTPAAMQRAFEQRAQEPLRLHRSRQGDGDRGGVGRGDRRRGAARRADRSRRRRVATPSVERVSRRPLHSSAAPPVPARATRFFSHGRWRQGECLFA